MTCRTCACETISQNNLKEASSCFRPFDIEVWAKFQANAADIVQFAHFIVGGLDSRNLCPAYARSLIQDAADRFIALKPTGEQGEALSWELLFIYLRVRFAD